VALLVGPPVLDWALSPGVEAPLSRRRKTSVLMRGLLSMTCTGR